MSSIKKRVVNSNLIEDGKLNSDKLNPVIFLGRWTWKNLSLI